MYVVNTLAQSNEASINYNNPSDVNKLDSQQLAEAIERGDITNIKIVDDNKLAAALKAKPSISVKLKDDDLARAVNQDLSLMDNNQIFGDIDSRAKNDVFILNNNPRIKKRWFEKYGIRDEGAELQSYNGVTVATKGKESTTFGVRDHPGAMVLQSGRLVLPNGVEIASGTVTKKSDGSLNVEHGLTIIPKGTETSVYVIDGVVIIGDKKFYSQSEMYIESKKEKITIKGKKIMELETKSSKQISLFTGAIIDYADGHRELETGTLYNSMINGKTSRIYSVSKLTQYFNKEAQCDSVKSCIVETENSIRISAKGSNDVHLALLDNSVTSFKAEEITDNSKITIRKNNAIAIISKDPLIVKGAPINLQLAITTIYEGKNYEYGSLIISEAGVLSRLMNYASNFITWQTATTFADQAFEKSAKLFEFGGANILDSYPKGLSNKIEIATSLEDFLKRMENYKGVNPWAAYDSAVPADYNEAEKFRYVIDPVYPNRVIDMRHFIKGGSACFFTCIAGDINEFSQYFYHERTSSNKKKSAGDPQDYYSSELGADFFRRHYKPSSKKTMAEQIRDYLKNHPP